MDIWHMGFSGRLGKDAEMRYTPAGQAVTSFNVATGRKYTAGNGEQVEETIWFRVSVWGKLAEACQSLTKGQRVYVEGRLTPDKASGGPKVFTKQDGTSAASFEVNAMQVIFLDMKSAKQSESESPY